MSFIRTIIGLPAMAVIAWACEGPAQSQPPAAPPRPAARANTDAPVLLPGDPALRASARVMGGAKARTVSAAAGGVSVQITSLPARNGAPLSVTRTEYGYDASFGRAGGLYNLTLTCDQPTDHRCADERFVRGLVAGLTPR